MQDAAAQLNKQAVFSADEFATRKRGLLEVIRRNNLLAVVITNPVSTYYFTGYQTFATRQFQAYYLTAGGKEAFLAWELEAPGVQLHTFIKDIETYPTGADKFAAADSVLRRLCPTQGAIGIETDSLFFPAKDYLRLQALIAKRYGIFDLARSIKALMVRKSPEEIAIIRKSAALTDLGMDAAVRASVSGATDNDVAARAIDAMVTAGSEYPSGFPIVTTGWRSGVPHTTFRRRQIESGDIVFIELSAAYERYNAPLMRTVFVGKPPDGAVALSEQVADTLECVLTNTRPGTHSRDLAAIAKKGLPLSREDLVFHNVYGYSVGVGFPPTWADDPSLEITEASDFELEVGMTFHSTISPRIFMKYGICLSQTWHVTSTGTEVLTRYPAGPFYSA